MPALSAKEQKIADFILDDPRFASRMTINEMAANLGVADSTVFKFTKKLGYRGFRDFRTDLLAEEFDPQISIHENVTPDDDPLTVAEKIIHSSAKSLNDTLALLSADDLERALDYLLGAARISFYGCGESGVIAHTGVTHEMYVAAKLAHNAGAKVILITSYPSQKISEYADITFVSTSDETSYRPESLSCRYAQLAIIDSLYTAMMFRLTETSTSLHKIREAINFIKEEA